MKKTFNLLILVLLFLAYGCCDQAKEVVEEKDFFPTEADDENLIALTSQELNLIFVKEGYREQVAEILMIEDPSASHWNVVLGINQQDTMSLEFAKVPTIRMRKVLYKIGDKGIYHERKCTGNRPAEEGQCIRRPGGVNFWYQRNIVGYSYCKRTQNPKDICKVIYTNTAYWAISKDSGDRCENISRRAYWHRPRWICIP